MSTYLISTVILLISSAIGYKYFRKDDSKTMSLASSMGFSIPFTLSMYLMFLVRV